MGAWHDFSIQYTVVGVKIQEDAVSWLKNQDKKSHNSSRELVLQYLKLLNTVCQDELLKAWCWASIHY